MGNLPSDRFAHGEFSRLKVFSGPRESKTTVNYSPLIYRTPRNASPLISVTATVLLGFLYLPRLRADCRPQFRVNAFVFRTRGCPATRAPFRLPKCLLE